MSKNQFELHVKADELVEEVVRFFGWQPSDFSIDVSSRHWYQYDGRGQANTAKMSRKIITALQRLAELERMEAMRE